MTPLTDIQIIAEANVTKTHLLNQPRHFSLLLQVFKLFFTWLVFNRLVERSTMQVYVSEKQYILSCMLCKYQNVQFYQSCTMVK